MEKPTTNQAQAEADTRAKPPAKKEFIQLACKLTGRSNIEEFEALRQAGWRKWEPREEAEAANELDCRLCQSGWLGLRGFRRGEERKAFAICWACGHFFEF